jgi:hypothetical protein
MVSLDGKKKELSEYKTNMVNIKQYASELQTFLALKQIGSDVEAKDTCLHALVNSLKQTKIACLQFVSDSGVYFQLTYVVGQLSLCGLV